VLINADVFQRRSRLQRHDALEQRLGRQPVAAATEHLERAMLEHALKECGGRMEETAARLGLSRKGLYLKRQRLGIEPPVPSAIDGSESAVRV
jgi:DNA-binding NtrC family response regulator